MTCSHNRVEATHMFCVDCGASTGAMVAALREQLASTDGLRANRDEWMERAQRAEAEVERLKAALEEALRGLRRSREALGPASIVSDGIDLLLARARQEGFSDGE